MGAILFIMRIVVFLASLGFYREGQRLEAGAAFVASTILFSAAAIVGAINGVAADLAKRFPRTHTERMVAAYEEHGGE